MLWRHHGSRPEPKQEYIQSGKFMSSFHIIIKNDIKNKKTKNNNNILIQMVASLNQGLCWERTYVK